MLTGAATIGGAGATIQNGTIFPRLHQAATQFEAMLLKDLLKPLSESTGMQDGESGEQTGTLQSFAVDAIAGTMAKSGALGFAKQIEQTLAKGAAQKYSQEPLKS